MHNIQSRSMMHLGRRGSLARAMVVVAFSMLGATAGACADKAQEEKVTELEKQKGELEQKLRTAEQSRRAAEQQLAQKAAAPKVNLDEVGKTLGVKPGEKLFATFESSLGTLVAELYWEKAPNTVLNFVGLAEGTKEWTDPRSNQKMTGKPLYDGTIFHRVIPDFMIQGGDPLGQGTGGPGFKFEDEFHPLLRHEGPGILSMANSGRNTNGSQFFITEKATPWLDNRHSVFGKITTGAELIGKITRVEKSDGPNGSRPKVDIVLKRVLIGRGQPKLK
jgi:peptidyl-prolyl cis-trans isomerase A (cyclophilin A)